MFQFYRNSNENITNIDEYFWKKILRTKTIENMFKKTIKNIY